MDGRSRGFVGNVEGYRVGVRVELRRVVRERDVKDGVEA